MRSFWILLAFLVTQHLSAAEEVKASHILVRTQDEADVIRNEIVEKGGDKKAFMEAARKHSKDVTTKRAGGALGWFTRPKMVREFSEAAFDLKTGEISLPVKSQYGYHLIFLEDRREQQPFTPPVQKPQPETQPKSPTLPPTHPTIPTTPVSNPVLQEKTASPSALAPQTPTPASATSQTPAPTPPVVTPVPMPAAAEKTATPPAVTPAVSTPPVPAAPPAPVKVQPVTLPPKAVKLTIGIKNNDRPRPPELPVEVELTLANNGKEDVKIFSQDLWPLGFSLSGEMAPQAPPATWDALKEKKIETPIITLPSRRSVAAVFTLNDYFKDLPPSGRYSLSWKPPVFLENIPKVFPEVAALPDFNAAKDSYGAAGLFQRDVAGAPAWQKNRNPDAEVVFSIFENIIPGAGKKYYAVVELDRQPQPIWVELFADRALEGVRQFAKLSLTGFYDGLLLFDIQKGNYIRGGSPTNDDFGGPEQFASVPVGQKVSHEKGTISMVTRTTRMGRQIGSIFFIARKPHPEWDSEHVAIGRIIAGEDVLDKVEAVPGRPQQIRKVNIVGSDKVPPEVVAAALAPLDTKATTPPAAARIVPTATIKTSKGEFTVELYEDDAPRTVNSFVDLAESGFFNTEPDKKKEMTFYYAVSGTMLLTGSPTNDSDGSPGYRIADETSENKKMHTKGTLSMLLEMDPISKNPVPNSAGSQFMICLQDMPAWNGLYTPFGRVTQGQDVVDKLEKGDKIESVTIATKRSHPYKAQKMSAR